MGVRRYQSPSRADPGRLGNTCSLEYSEAVTIHEVRGRGLP
jgi:hypothetical protein